jgi:hypothetical protein
MRGVKLRFVLIMKNFTNLAQFKKALQVGDLISCIAHKATFVGRDEKNQAVYAPKKMLDREISIVQSNAFAMKTTKTDGTVVDSWCQFPKASDCVFKVPGQVTILEDGEPILTYYSLGSKAVE